MSRHRWLLTTVVLGAVTITGSALAAGARPARSAERPAELVGLYRMEAPEAVRPSARLRFPATEVTFLRLMPNGQSRLENVTIADRAGTAAASVEVGPVQAQPWAVRVPSVGGRAAAPLAQLCFQAAGALQCQRYERDDATGDLSLFAGASASSVTLRLERVRTP